MGLKNKRFFFEFKCSRESIKLTGKGGGGATLPTSQNDGACKNLLRFSQVKKSSKRIQVSCFKCLGWQGARKGIIYLTYKCLRSSCVVYSECSKENPERGRERESKYWDRVLKKSLKKYHMVQDARRKRNLSFIFIKD